MTSKIYQCLQTISRKKSLDCSKSMETKLNRSLNTVQLVFYGIAQMIGAGIYVLSGHIIHDKAGPATNISFLFAGIACVFTATCYCEFATLIPKAGSCYVYSYILLGELPAFLIGWTILLDFLIAMSAIAKGFSGTLNILTGGHIVNFTHQYLPLLKSSSIIDSSADIVASGLILLLVIISLTGANITLSVSGVVTGVSVTILIIISVACFVLGDAKNFYLDGGYIPFGFIGIFQGAGIALFAFSGFESLANSSEETIDPKKSIPIALFTSLGVMSILFIVSSTGLTMLSRRELIDQSSPFVFGFQMLGNEPFKWIAGIGTLMATGATKLTSMYLIPRIIYALANDGLLFSWLACLDSRTKNPSAALLTGGSISIILAMFIRLEVLADMTSLGTLVSYCFIGINLIVLRYLHQIDDDSNDEDVKSNNEKTGMKIRYPQFEFMNNRLIFTGIFIFLILGFTALILIFKIFSVISSYGLIFLVAFITTTLLVLLFLLSVYEPKTVNPIFTTPMMPLTPMITIFLNIAMMVNLSFDTWIRCIIWTLIGILIYVSYGLWHSKLRYMSSDEDINQKVPILADQKLEKENN